jgi:formiminotetrahydrofolate cyclodeaminase
MLRESTLGAYLDALASGDATPGGGAAAALTLVQAASLAAMVCHLTLGKEKFAASFDVVNAALKDALDVKTAAEVLADTDTVAFQGYMSAASLPKDTPEEKAARSQALQAALQDAADVPLSVHALCGHLLRSGGTLDLLAQHGNPAVLSDVKVAVCLAKAALEASEVNVRVNLDMIKDPGVKDALERRLAQGRLA